MTNSEENLNISEEAEVFVFPASFAQQRLWFLNQLAPDNPFYNVGCAIRLTGKINITALQQTFHEIVRRHEVLRTNFIMIEGQPMQAIAPPTPTLTVSLPIINLQHLSSTQRETEARSLATVEAKRPFNLATDLLLRVTLLQLNSAEYVLLLNLHHIVADGWSIGILIRELAELYTGFAEPGGGFGISQPSPLPPLPLQYADFAEWQREWLQGEVLETQLTYWRQQLNGISTLSLPTDKPRPAIPTYLGAKQFLELPHPLSEALKKLSRQHGVTLYVTLLAGFQVLLYRYTGQEDIAVGSPIANRNRREIEGLIGFFVNSLVLRSDLSGNPTFRELLARVKEVALGAYAHQDLPFEKLVEELHPQRDSSRNPLFQVSFALQNTPVSVLELPELSLSLLDYDSGSAKLDLEFHLWEDKTSLKVQVVYSTDLFNDSTIARMLGHFQVLLEGIVANPEQHISKLPILTEAEVRQLLVEFNENRCAYPPRQSLGTRRSQAEPGNEKPGNENPPRQSLGTRRSQAEPGNEKPGNENPPRQSLGTRRSQAEPGNEKCQKCIHELFEAQVEQTPDAIAVEFLASQLTYRELNNSANQLAHYLQKLGVMPEVLVGICMERSLDLIVGVLGILKAGGAYLPLDPTYPVDRLSFMLADAAVPVLLTEENLATDDSDTICVHLRSSAVKKEIAKHSQENPTSDVTPHNLAYVIYTSGSTGKPKGVMVEHRGLSNLAAAQIEVFNLQPESRVLQFASLSFDASIFEIIMALGSGGTLCLAKKESLLPGEGLIKLLRDRSITHVTLPPAVLAVLPKAELPALQTIICAGEFCSEDIVKRWWRSNLRFFNAYGVTEATVWSTVAEISDCSGKISIGSPILNTQVYILDAQRQLVPIGVVGEMYIGGEGVARGYLNRPDLTAEKFLPNPFVGAEAGLYKTGDLARYLPDGNIEFLGRIDSQVKIRGFRIELGEIEAAIAQYPGILETVAVAKEDESGNKRLVAYIVSHQGHQGTSSEIRGFLKEKLPEYMIPSAFVVLDSLPLTPNGKIDRHNLPAPLSLTQENTFVAPSTPIEIILAEIWAEILKCDAEAAARLRVGIGDNFFDLGGDSLLAVRLIDRINKQCDRELPLSALFLNPTIEGLASHLSPERDSQPVPPEKGKGKVKGKGEEIFTPNPIPSSSPSWGLGGDLLSPLVAIQPEGKNPPFFCVHPIFGVVFPYYELAYNLGKNQPFYGLQPKGINPEETPLTRIEDMAAYYITALRVVQPNGPYFIGGWSFGGLVAFEMAQQLKKSGHEVALLAILDTLAPIPANKPSLGDTLKFLFTTVAANIWTFLLDYFYLIVGGNLSWNAIMGQMTVANFLPKESRRRILNELTTRSMFSVFQANSKAAMSYVPQTYPGRITLFRSTPSQKGANVGANVGAADLGWGELAGEGVEVHIFGGNHLTMLKKPNVQGVAEKLRELIANG